MIAETQMGVCTTRAYWLMLSKSHDFRTKSRLLYQATVTIVQECVTVHMQYRQKSAFPIVLREHKQKLVIRTVRVLFQSSARMFYA